ncbi:DUF2087 domain-containing protein [Arthrobacter koreensis]|uniref:DUF2087 domain-containing protein n=1 Tax=Arthrobacter koreensis TaxID=199136 RepID=UPI00240A2B1C|nr:DUF2087 domain-containing protein [Arthrobacter koreensis]MDF2497532.1 uncharacterized protein [Arthrobacter koreensis]MEB7448610.1 DUF2087 domain-containing protein [Arthrobacter koreensis]
MNHPGTAGSSHWKAVAAALADTRRLDLYARIITAAGKGEPLFRDSLDRAEAKSLDALQKAGLVRSGDGGLFPVPEVFSRLLAADRTPRDESPMRHLGPGSSGSLPAKRTERLEVLHHLAGEVFSRHGVLGGADNPAASRARLTEAEVTGRLAALTKDPAMFRRAMVDEGIVRRSPDGSSYWLAAPRPASGIEFAG